MSLSKKVELEQQVLFWLCLEADIQRAASCGVDCQAAAVAGGAEGTYGQGGGGEAED
jgi:hypothetical protein